MTTNEGRAEACVVKFQLDGTIMAFTNVKLEGEKWKDNLKLLGYEPIIIEGKAYSLGDLHGSTGWNIMEKGM